VRKGIPRKALVGFAGVTVAAASIAFAVSATATSAPTAAPQSDLERLPSHVLPNPLAEKRVAMRQEALTGLLTGRYTAEQRGVSTVVDTGGDVSTSAGQRQKGKGSKTRYVELARETTDRIFVILAEFGDQPNPFPPDPNAQRFEGPLHNQIPQPDRSVDNSTVWRADYSREYYQDLYFGGGESLKNYFETQSSGRYSVDGVVTDWVKVPYTQGRYGTDACGDIVCSTVWALIRDAANQWVADRLAAGATMDEINAELAEFDTWDRYDWDGDGNFNEPDGYIDHFQIVHAGGDQADGDPIYGTDAIWSHRWYANFTNVGLEGPSPDFLIGGTRIGNTNFWVGDYTMQPENGGRSVFYHEYAHDLDLPDDYGPVDNNNEHWTLMAQSRLGAAEDEGIGERGGDLGAWNKLQLGWLNYTVVRHNEHKVVQLGPQEYNTNLPQGLVVTLPDQEVTIPLVEPYAGEHQWYSGHRNGNSTLSLSRTLTVPTDDPTLRFQTRYDIETGFDFAYVAVNGAPISGTVGSTTVTTTWDGTTTDWVPAEFDLSAYAGQTVTLSIVYQTDPAVGGNDDNLPDGVFVDEITIGDFSDGAEAGPGDWQANGWSIVGASTTDLYPHFYIAGWRSYVSYDRYLKTGPYYFGYLPDLPDKVDHYAYQEGLLISYWNTLYEDNNTAAHPGYGRNLYIDAHPQPFARSDGELWRARIQVYDAPFNTKRTDQVTLHHNGKAETFGGLPGNPVFRDTDTYWYPELPNHGVKLPGYGVTIRVLNTGGGKMQVKVN
jgi:immune inhibitor A